MFSRKAKAISFTPEVLKAKTRVLEEHGHFQTRRSMRPQPVLIDAKGGGKIWHLKTRNGFANSDLNGTWPDWMTRHARDQDGNVYPAVAPWVAGDVLWLRERALVLKVLGPADALRVLLRYDDGIKSEWIPYPARLKPPQEGRCIANGVFREGARHFFEVVSVKAGRACDISEEDAVLEGIQPFSNEWTFNEGLHLSRTAQQSFRALWTSIYGHDAWEQWCWAYTLRRATT